jgi:hypothetical protein
MKNQKFPSWSAPLVGMIAGALCGLKGAMNAPIPPYLFVLGGALIGGLAGSLIFIIDPRPETEIPEGLPHHLSTGHVENPSGVVGRFLAIAGLFLCWTPFLGFVLNSIGLAVNWKSRDWARIISIIGLLIGTLVAFAMAIILTLEAIK